MKQKELINLITESITKQIMEIDRHRPGYYKEYAKKRRAEGKSVDRHRPGYYEEYAKTHPEWAARHPELLRAKKNKIKKKAQDSNRNTYLHYHIPSSYWEHREIEDELDDMRDEDWGDWYPGDND